MMPDPNCYGCLGTGKIVGFGRSGKRCPCTECHGCGGEVTHTDEGHGWCDRCHP